MQEDHKKSGKKVLEERKRAFEAKYQQDEEIRFKARIRATKLVGQWAAARMGLEDAEAKAYVKDLVELGFSDASGEKTFAKLLTDLDAAGKAIDDHKLRTEILRLSLEAEEQIMTEILGENE
jgi:hypothetical protein